MIQFFLGLVSFLVLSFIFFLIVKVSSKYEKRNFWLGLLFTIIIVQFFKWAFIDLTRVPTGSMEKTLIPGDFVLVSKLHYGLRTPSTLLQIPLTHQKTRFFEFTSYLDWIQIPFFRLPGFSRVKRNDAVVFNAPIEPDIPMDVRTFYVKRCIGLPGDFISMHEGKYIVNKENIVDAPSKMYEYVVKTNEMLHKDWFKKYNVTEYVIAGENLYIIRLLVKNNIPQILEDIENDISVVSVKMRSIDPENEFVFVRNFDNYIDLSNWGGEEGILVPKRSSKIKLTKENVNRYWDYIKSECGKDIELINGSEVYFKGKKIDEYEFKYDYYFMIGDNIYGSFDSRYWGFVREDEIYAKALLVVFSKGLDSLFSGLKFRFLKTMWS